MLKRFFTFIPKYYAFQLERINNTLLENKFFSLLLLLSFFYPETPRITRAFQLQKSSILSHKRSELQPSFDTYKWNVKGIEFTDRNINNISMSAFSPSDKHYISSPCIRIIERMTHSLVVIRI